MVNSHNEKQNSLFYKVWGNIVIFKNIFRFVRLYKKNERVVFKSRKQLLEYSEREFIHCLIYSSNELLEVGDLPIGCVLKYVKLKSHIHTNIHGSKIPFGVESLEFLWSGSDKSLARTQISTFPSSLKTLNEIFLGKNEKQQIKNKEEEEEEDENVCLRKGDFPDGIEILKMPYFQLRNIRSKDILPNSIKHLSISYGKRKFEIEIRKEPGKFNVLPPNIEKLFIHNSCNIIKDSLLNTLTSLKELRIKNYNHGFHQIVYEAGSLPPNITTLSLESFKSKLEIGVIPFGVKHLEFSRLGSDSIGVKHLEFSRLGSNPIEIGAIPSSVETLSIDSFIIQPEILPPSLTHLTFTQFYKEGSNTLDYIVSYFSKLPKSVTSLTFNLSFKYLKLTFPPSITKIEFKNLNNKNKNN
ncbi:hypothetical protein ACTFIZ_012777 [Dictyostelium cf. discoideum]